MSEKLRHSKHLYIEQSVKKVSQETDTGLPPPKKMFRTETVLSLAFTKFYC